MHKIRGHYLSGMSPFRDRFLPPSLASCCDKRVAEDTSHKETVFIDGV